MKRYTFSRTLRINLFHKELPLSKEYYIKRFAQIQLQMSIAQAINNAVFDALHKTEKGGFVPQNKEPNGEAVITGRKSRNVSIHFEGETVTPESIQEFHEQLQRRIESLKAGDYKPKQ